MSAGHLRPRFAFVVAGTPDQTLERIVAEASRPESPCNSRSVGNHLDLSFPKPARAIWSPHIHLEFLEHPTGTEVHALVGPQPTTWTLYMFTGIHLLGALAFAGMYGFVQVSLGHNPWALWVAAFAAAALALLYLLSQIGKNLAAGQTRQLIEVIERALGIDTSLADLGDTNFRHSPNPDAEPITPPR